MKLSIPVLSFALLLSLPDAPAAFMIFPDGSPEVQGNVKEALAAYQRGDVADAIKRFSASLAALDSAVHEASQAWKVAVWEATMASTRLEELEQARDALGAQLVDVTSDTEARRNALLVATWRALAAVWACQLGRGGAAAKCLEA